MSESEERLLKIIHSLQQDIGYCLESIAKIEDFLLSCNEGEEIAPSQCFDDIDDCDEPREEKVGLRPEFYGQEHGRKAKGWARERDSSSSSYDC